MRISRYTAPLLFAVWTAQLAPAQSPSLVRDINRQPRVDQPGSAPREFTPLGGWLYFQATTRATGAELFRTDGTAGRFRAWHPPTRRHGTRQRAVDVLVRVIATGSASALPRQLTQVGDEVWFVANDARHGLGLWRTDGTLAGTTHILELAAAPRTMAVSGGRLFFDHEDLVHDRELWLAPTGATTEIRGTGCGFELRAPTLRSNDPVLGRPFAIKGRGGAPGSLRILYLGLPPSRPTTVAGHCLSWVDFATGGVAHTVVDASPPWSLALVVPPDPALAGLRVALQSFDGPTPSATGIEASNGLWSTIGSR